MRGLVRDLRYAVRRLGRSPTFALTAVLCVALGIGANTAMFSVVNAVLLSPLPFEDAHELVIAWETRNESVQPDTLLRFRLAPPDHLLPPEPGGPFPWYTIGGVAGDVRRWSISAQAQPEVYIPQRQDMDVAREFFVVVHTERDGGGLSDAMRQAVLDVDPAQPVDWVRPLESMMTRAVSQPRFNTELVGTFALTALLLAIIGIYGLVANTVATRTAEIGVRVAFGARPGQVLRHVAGQAMWAVLVLGVAAVAASVPSLRAARIDPVAALETS